MKKLFEELNALAKLNEALIGNYTTYEFDEIDRIDFKIELDLLGLKQNIDYNITSDPPWNFSVDITYEADDIPFQDLVRKYQGEEI